MDEHSDVCLSPAAEAKAEGTTLCGYAGTHSQYRRLGVCHLLPGLMGVNVFFKFVFQWSYGMDRQSGQSDLETRW